MLTRYPTQQARFSGMFRSRVSSFTSSHMMYNLENFLNAVKPAGDEVIIFHHSFIFFILTDHD